MINLNLVYTPFIAGAISPVDDKIPAFLKDLSRGRYIRDRKGRYLTTIPNLYAEPPTRTGDTSLTLYYDKTKLGVLTQETDPVIVPDYSDVDISSFP